jgi:cytochrome c oxidase subunit IV
MDMEMELTGNATAPAIEHAAAAKAPAPAAAHGQQHPIWLYLVVWTALFILSACSYLVDYFDFHGYLRWFLIVLFMMMKASLIVAIFMHMAWERLALVIAILLPPLAVLVLMAMMAVEANYTNLTRLIFFGAGQ